MEITVRATFWKDTDDFKEIVLPENACGSVIEKAVTFILGQEMPECQNLLWIENIDWLKKQNNRPPVIKRNISVKNPCDVCNIANELVKWREERIALHRTWGF